MSHPTVQWHVWSKLPPRGNAFGHGVHYHDGKARDRDAVIAFIVGFDWLRNKHAVVRGFHIRPNSITSARVLAAMRRRIETLVAQQQLVAQGMISSRIRTLGNC